MNIKKIAIQFIPPVLLKYYRQLKKKNKIIPKEEKKFARTHSQVVTTEKILLNKKILAEGVDGVNISTYMEWGNPFEKNTVGKYQYNEQYYKLDNKAEIEIDFTNYGIWIIQIKYLLGKEVITTEEKVVRVEAPEYNIAYLVATLPVLFFLFNLWKITGKNSPTIVVLERILFNYKKLPENVFPFPLASEEELYTAYTGFNRCAQRMVSYIGMLYRMNPGAKFNLYLCDHQAYSVLSFMYANGIPEKNFTVHLFSDGTGSYDCFNYSFGTENAGKLYNDMKQIWTVSKQKAIETGVQKWGKETFTHYGKPCVSKMAPTENCVEHLANRFAYSYVETNENNNFELVLHDVSLLKGNSAILGEMTGRVHTFDFKKGRNSIAEHRDELCRMLDMDMQPFEKSYKNGKRICILVNSFPLSETEKIYIEKTITYFGQDYDYYLKDHPWTAKDEKRVQCFKSMGIKLLDAKIPTEIYMLLEPKVYIAGYLSSVFLSVGVLDNPEEQVLSVWNVKNCDIKTNCLNFRAKTAMNLETDKVVIYE